VLQGLKKLGIEPSASPAPGQQQQEQQPQEEGGGAGKQQQQQQRQQQKQQLDMLVDPGLFRQVGR
jgi:hypothetical protein